MNKLITIKGLNIDGTNTVTYNVLLYKDIIIFKPKFENVIKFYDLINREYIYNHIKIKIGKSNKMYVNNNKFVFIGNGNIKIYDLCDKLRLIKTISDYKRVTGCEFSNDGTVMLFHNNSTTSMLFNFKTGNKIPIVTNNGKWKPTLHNDIIYIKDLYTKQLHKYDLNYEKLPEEFETKLDKYNRIYSYSTADNGLSYRIYDKITDEEILVKINKLDKFLNNSYICGLFENIIVYKTDDSKIGHTYEFYRINLNSKECIYIGTVSNSNNFYVPNNKFCLIENTADLTYSLYSIKGD